MEETKITIAAPSGEDAESGPADNTNGEKEIIQTLLQGYQTHDDDDCVWLVKSDEERNQRLQQDLQNDSRRKNAVLLACVAVSGLELYWSLGGDVTVGFVCILVPLAFVINTFGFVYVWLLLLGDFFLNSYKVPVAECTVLRKLTKRSLFQKTFHVLAKYRVDKKQQQQQQQSFLIIFSTPKSRYDYIQIGEELGDVYCRRDNVNPKFAVYQPTERGRQCRWSIIRVGLLCFVLNYISFMVGPSNPTVTINGVFCWVLGVGIIPCFFPWIFLFFLPCSITHIQQGIAVVDQQLDCCGGTAARASANCFEQTSIGGPVESHLDERGFALQS